MSIIDRRAMIIRIVDAAKEEDVRAVADNIIRAAKRHALTVASTGRIVLRPRGYTTSIVVVGGRRALSNLKRELPALSEHPKTTVIVRSFRPLAQHWVFLTAETTELPPAEFVKNVLEIKRKAVSLGLNVYGPRWYPVLSGESRRATMAVSGSPGEVRSFVDYLYEGYNVSEVGLFLLRELYGVRKAAAPVKGMNIMIRVVQTIGGPPELQAQPGRLTYRCPICGVVLTAHTRDALEELIYIHMRGHYK